MDGITNPVRLRMEIVPPFAKGESKVLRKISY